MLVFSCSLLPLSQAQDRSRCTGVIQSVSSVTYNGFGPGISAVSAGTYTEGLAMCISYTFGGSDYELHFVFEEAIEKTVFQADMQIIDPSYVWNNITNYDGWFCHCPATATNWEIKCSDTKRFSKDKKHTAGLTCKLIAQGDSDIFNTASCESCWESDTYHVSRGCTYGSTNVPCRKIDAIDFESYTILVAGQDGELVIKAHIEWWKDTVKQTDTSSFEVIGGSGFQGSSGTIPGLNGAISLVLENSEDKERDVKPRAFYGGNKCQTATDRMNFTNMYAIPEELLGIYDFDNDKIGWANGIYPTYRYDRSKLDEKFRSMYEYIDTNGIIRKLNFPTMKSLEKDKYQLENHFGNARVNALAGTTSVEVEQLITFHLEIGFGLEALITNLNTYFINGVGTTVLSPPVCNERNGLTDTVTCELTATQTVEDAIVTVTSGSDVLSMLSLKTGTTTPLVVHISSDSFENDLAQICVNYQGNTAAPKCVNAKSTYIRNDNPDDVPGLEDDGEDEGDGGDSISISMIVTISCVIAAAVIILLIIIFTRKIWWGCMSKKIKEWKKDSMYKKLKREKDQKLFEQEMGQKLEEESILSTRIQMN